MRACQSCFEKYDFKVLQYIKGPGFGVGYFCNNCVTTIKEMVLNGEGEQGRISLCGVTLDKIYCLVKNWKDLIKTNLDFMNAIVPCTFYYGGPLLYETTNNTQFFQNCIALNNKGFFTTGSQPYLAYEDKDDDGDDEKYYQNSYVEFNSEQYIGPILYDSLQKDSRIFTAYVNYKYKICKDNFINDIYNLTRKFASPKEIKFDEDHNQMGKINEDGYIHSSNWHRRFNTPIYDSYVKNWDIIYTMMCSSCNIFVVANENEGKTLSAPEIVLEHINKLKLSNIF